MSAGKTGEEGQGGQEGQESCGSPLKRPLRRRPVSFDDITARGLGLDWPQEICGCDRPSDNDQGVCMGCGGVIQAQSKQ